jgi:autotransporter-associated beta strand protein
VLIVNGGTINTASVTLDNRGATGGEDTLEMNGGLLNLGQHGLNSPNAGDPSTYEVRLRGGTIRATATWNSNLELNVAAGGTGIHIDTNGNSVTFSGTIVGAGTLIKDGAGSLVLTGVNTNTGTTILNGGVLTIGAGAAGGGIGSGGATLGAGTLLFHNRIGTTTISGAVSGSGQIAVVGGTLRLSDVTSSSQVTVSTAGTFSAKGSVGSISATDGSTLEAGAGGAGDFTATSLALSGATTLKVSAGTTNSKFNILNNNGFSASGSSVIQLNAVNLTAGNYVLVDYAGALGGAGFGAFSLSGLPIRAVGGLVNNILNSSIDLNITAIDYPKWTGAINADWDTTTSNWKLIVSGLSTTYLNQDAVLFDDTATGSTVVNLTAPLTPSAVTVNAASKLYIFFGAGSLTGTMGLTKQGNARAVLFTNNTYTGPTDVQAGTLQVGDGAVGAISSSSAVSIATPGTVELNLPPAAVYASPTTGTGTLRTAGDNSFELAANVLSGGLKVEIAGNPTQIINGNNQVAFTGNIVISGGTYRALGTQALGTATGTTTITSTLDLNGLDLGADQIFVSGTGVNGNGAVVNTGGGIVFGLHNVKLDADTAFGGTQRWDIRDSGLLDLAGHKLTKVGNNQVSLVNVNATAGDIDINAGIFSIEAASQVQTGGTITLNPGGNLGLWVNNAGAFTRQIVAKGGGIVELGSGGSTTVNSPISLQANLTFFVNNGNTVQTHAGNITESGGSYFINKDGPGRLILTGNNVWTGGTTVTAGTLQIGNGTAATPLGTGPLNVNGTLVLARSNATPTVLTNDVNAGGMAGIMIITSGGIVNPAPGVNIKLQELDFGVNGQNDTVGGTLNIGPTNTMSIGSWIQLGDSGGGGTLTQGVINQTGGTVDVLVPADDGRRFVLGHWGATQGIYNLSGGTLNSLTAPMSVSWDGDGTFNLSGTGVANLRGMRFGHNGGRTGVFNLTGGTLALADLGIFAEFNGTPNDINFGGGTVRADAPNVPITQPVELTGTNGNVTINTNANTITMAGPITGAGGFTKTGNGTLVIDAPNNATGPFIVNGGTLALQGAQTNNRLPNGSSITVNAGATLEFRTVNPVPFNVNYLVNGGTITNGAGVDHVHIGSITLNGGTWTTDPAAISFDGENYQLEGNVTVIGTAPSFIKQQGGDATNRGVGWNGPITFNVADATNSSAPDLIVETELENSAGGVAHLVKSGAGTMTVNFASRLDGGIEVVAGTLGINGPLVVAAPLAVLGGGRLQGSGPITGMATSVVVDGKLAPGTGVGTLTLDFPGGGVNLVNAVTPANSASLEFELTIGAGDRVVSAERSARHRRGRPGV